ncbi:MAG: prephenate dehydrogenase/arogenate dehydrogenase family protein [Verrucomicrobiota bacterium]|nr:prephenate dehydrogenase/arogenate dehydrogenase family protein [Verrucomicrobiota bacterium]
MTNVAVVGPGLLGGSIALALQRQPGTRVAVWGRRGEAVEEARRRGLAAFASTEIGAVVRDADLVVLCTPIGVMPVLAREIAPIIRPEAIVTDVGSVKQAVVAELAPIFEPRGRFVGSHPMAGSEQTGLEAARADLFEGAVCIVTPNARTPESAASEVSAFWERLGCRVRVLDPGEHDDIAALVSHLPHLLAATLVQTVAGKNGEAFEFAGPGFRDATRVASGAPAMWAEILQTNREAVCRGAEAMIEKLREIITLLERAEPMSGFLSEAKDLRDRLRLRN